MVTFRNRFEAGRKLAEAIKISKKVFNNIIVLGIPRGGVAVGYPVAKKYFCELEAISLRKLPIPGNDQMGFGAVTLDRQIILNNELINQGYVKKEDLEPIVDEVYEEVLRRDRLYRGLKLFPNLEKRTVIIVDDGLATGYTMLAAIKYAKEKKAGRIFAAVPVAHYEAFELVKDEVDDIVCLYVSRESSFAVASFYEYFPDMKDKEVTNILKMSKEILK
ncbi:MAG: hypothetical protein A2539_08765 [Elusimicrobia bacterium RIFOXYD2_FULL_34_15]|nr:MAG: hypothetical protein A2539_08765 [Elusimicrobia bacterium RIFOXYD2_FULL_34_15]